MFGVDIQFAGGQQRFNAGDKVSGLAEVVLPEKFPLTSVGMSFNCLGEVKWIEYHGTPRHLLPVAYYDTFDFHHEELKLDESQVKIAKEAIHKKVTIPFVFTIPKDKQLPSTMISQHGFVKYFVRVTIKEEHQEQPKKFIKELIVQSPIEKNLMITVGGTAEKSVLLHNGTVSMNASLCRKGFAPGESITVHVNVDNKTNTAVVPRLTLYQVQIFMCGERHKTVESTLNEEPISGSEVQPHTHAEELIDVKIPQDESLSIKSSVITVKYFVRITLDIPHSFDLNVNLPVVVTSKQVLEQLQEKKQPERVPSP